MFSSQDPDWPGYDCWPKGIDPIDPAATRPYTEGSNDWRRWFMHGFHNGNESEAARAYERAAQLNPANGLVRLLLGHARLSLKQYAQAQRDFIAVNTLRPDLVQAWRFRAILHDREKQDEEALYCWQQVLRLEPTAEDYWKTACTLFYLGRFRETIVVLEEAVRLHENHVPAQRALAFLTFALDEYDVARAHMRRLYELDEDLARAAEDELYDENAQVLLERRH